MRKNLEMADPNSCFRRAGPEEMLFVLLERDPAFAATVRFWVAERIRLGKNQPTDQQIAEAERCASYVETQQKFWASAARSRPLYLPVCPGHGTHATGPKCCEKAGQYNGYGSDGPLLFLCPKSCSCHD